LSALAGAGVVVLGVVTLALAGLSAALLLLLLRSRRRVQLESRELVQVVEDLRAGKARRVELEAGSALGVLADAVHRLGHELHGRWSEAESASERP
jgi:hypothetical protein